MNDPLNGVTKGFNWSDRVPILLLRSLCFDPDQDPINFDNSCFEVGWRPCARALPPFLPSL